jgi:hypothetical protein
MPTYDLRPLVANRRARFGALVTALNLELVPSAVHRYNSEWGPRYLGRLPTETIPTETRRLTAFRGRLGLLIEYGLAVTMDDLLCADYGDEYRMSAEIVNKFPDFYLRRTNGEPQLRIDFKVLHDESAEYSARMTEPTTSLRADDDVLLYAAWRWSRTRLHGTELVFPEVAEAMAVSAIAIAKGTATLSVAEAMLTRTATRSWGPASPTRTTGRSTESSVNLGGTLPTWIPGSGRSSRSLPETCQVQ